MTQTAPPDQLRAFVATLTFSSPQIHHFLQNSTPSLARLSCQITALAAWSMREI